MLPKPEPRHISISKSRGIKIDWLDGHHSEYSLDWLRRHCPCATCTGAHREALANPENESPFRMYKPALRIESAEPVGSYAIQIAWSDGHRSGIYSWEHLREICPCPECAQQRKQNEP